MVCVDEILIIRNWPAQDGFETFIKKQTLAGFAWKGSLVRRWFSHNVFTLGCKHAGPRENDAGLPRVTRVTRKCKVFEKSISNTSFTTY